jgi:hypothetical protein
MLQLKMIKTEANWVHTKPNRELSETTPTANLPVKQNPHGVAATPTNMITTPNKINPILFIIYTKT